MPVDEQIVYLESHTKDAEWLYPSNFIFPDGSYLTKYSWLPHSDIVEALERWPAWQWHQCGEDMVCLESVWWPNYYLYPGEFGNTINVAHSRNPKKELWTKNEILDYNLQTGVMKLKSQYNEKTFILKAYIPPRCFGYELVSAFYNDNNVDVTHTYTVNRGISKQATRSQNLSTGLIFEIASAIIVGIEPSISLTYIWEDTINNEQTKSESFTTTESPGESIEIFQKVASYSRHYILHSGFPTVTC